MAIKEVHINVIDNAEAAVEQKKWAKYGYGELSRGQRVTLQHVYEGGDRAKWILYSILGALGLGLAYLSQTFRQNCEGAWWGTGRVVLDIQNYTPVTKLAHKTLPQPTKSTALPKEKPVEVSSEDRIKKLSDEIEANKDAPLAKLLELKKKVFQEEGQGISNLQLRLTEHIEKAQDKIHKEQRDKTAVAHQKALDSLKAFKGMAPNDMASGSFPESMYTDFEALKSKDLSDVHAFYDKYLGDRPLAPIPADQDLTTGMEMQKVFHFEQMVLKLSDRAVYEAKNLLNQYQNIKIPQNYTAQNIFELDKELTKQINDLSNKRDRFFQEAHHFPNAQDKLRQLCHEMILSSEVGDWRRKAYDLERSAKYFDANFKPDEKRVALQNLIANPPTNMGYEETVMRQKLADMIPQQLAYVDANVPNSQTIRLSRIGFYTPLAVPRPPQSTGKPEDELTLQVFRNQTLEDFINDNQKNLTIARNRDQLMQHLNDGTIPPHDVVKNLGDMYVMEAQDKVSDDRIKSINEGLETWKSFLSVPNPLLKTAEMTQEVNKLQQAIKAETKSYKETSIIPNHASMDILETFDPILRDAMSQKTGVLLESDGIDYQMDVGLYATFVAKLRMWESLSQFEKATSKGMVARIEAIDAFNNLMGLKMLQKMVLYHVAYATKEEREEDLKILEKLDRAKLQEIHKAVAGQQKLPLQTFHNLLEKMHIQVVKLVQQVQQRFHYL